MNQHPATEQRLVIVIVGRQGPIIIPSHLRETCKISKSDEQHLQVKKMEEILINLQLSNVVHPPHPVKAKANFEAHCQTKGESDKLKNFKEYPMWSIIPPKTPPEVLEATCHYFI
jgi:bifunctional DNA-binding transcriptional regulator/antitoxin component of YhaV-PrlF toxin-antitoxin module